MFFVVVFVVVVVVVVVVVLAVVVFGYQLTGRSRRFDSFCSCIFRCSAMYDSVIVRPGGVGWGGANNIPWHLHTYVMLRKERVGWGRAKNVPWHLQTYVMLH